MLPHRALHHPRLRLSAIAIIIRSVRAVIDRSEMRTRRSQLLCHLLVNSVHRGLVKKTTAHTRLIGYDDHRQIRIVQFSNGPCRERKHTKLPHIIQVANVFRNRPVAIEKNRRAQQRRLRQDAPPRAPRQATRQPPPQRCRAKSLSYNDDRSGIAAKSTDCNTASLARSCNAA